MRVHTYASLGHYHDHLAPILAAIPEEYRGESWSPSESKPWGRPIHPGVWQRDDVMLVAGYADAQRIGAHGPRLAYIEHGAGQTYEGDSRSAGHGAFSGGDGLGHVGLFLCPHDTVAARWRTRYPQAAVEVVGCPRLDPWHASIERRGKAERNRGSVVAVTFHHSNAQVSEQQPAWTHYREALPALRDAVEAVGGRLLGHGHPRAHRTYEAFWGRLGVEWTPNLGDVFDRADLLILDNTSAGPEAASLGIPLLWLNCPWYRRSVDHQGRFWEWPRDQIQCDEPGDLIERTFEALTDPPRVRQAREAMVRSIYAYTDGRASERAAAAVLRFAGQA